MGRKKRRRILVKVNFDGALREEALYKIIKLYLDKPYEEFYSRNDEGGDL